MLTPKRLSNTDGHKLICSAIITQSICLQNIGQFT
jgi:hypothetical protein